MGRGAHDRAGGAVETSPGGTLPVDAYDLAIDAQVEKFLEVKQKLSYFLITASVAIIAFVSHFVVSNFRAHGRFTIPPWELRLIVVSAILGLLAAGLAIVGIHLEVKSYQLHLGHRYRRQTWDALNHEEQGAWDRVNKQAAQCLRGAFVSLVGEIALVVFFVVAVFW